VQGKWKTLKVTVHRGTTAGQRQLNKLAILQQRQQQEEEMPDFPEEIAFKSRPRNTRQN
jgi:hypothetical protein